MTATAETSRAAYEQLVASGQLRERAAKIMDTLINLGPSTSGEVLDALGIRNVNAWRARFTELQGRGLIVEHGTRVCKVGGRVCVVWRPTGRTKPLALRRGTRDNLGTRLKVMRDLGKRMAEALEQNVLGAVDHPHSRSLIDEYRKLAAGRG